MAGRILVSIALLLLASCAGLQQFPDVSPSGLDQVDSQYAQTLEQVYAATNPERQKQIRNRYIEARMAVIDTHFREFETGLARESTGVDFGVALTGVAVGAAGAFAAETASRILSAVSGGLAGAQAAYSKAALYDQASTALLAQMHAARKSIAVEIFSRWSSGIEQYPLWLANRDLDAYYFAGSVPGAIVATSADAQVKEQQAEVLLAQISPGAVTPEMFDVRERLGSAIDNLSAADAKALVPKIEAAFPAIRPFIQAQYPEDMRAADETGAQARTVLRRAIVLTVRSSEDANRWQAAIDSL